MSKDELRIYWMVKQIQLRILNNPTPRDSYLPFKTDAIKFNADIAALELLMPASLIIGKGFTLDQNVAKSNCSNYWDDDVCKIIKGFALKYGKNAFFQQVNFTRSTLNKIKLPKYYMAISNLNDACELILEDTEYIAGTYAVTTGVLTGGMALANTFLSLNGNADQVRSAKGVTGFEIKGALKILQFDLEVMDKDVYGITNTTFRNQYLKDRKIDKSIIHNKVNLLGIDSVTRLPILKLFAINQGALRGNHTDIDGMAELHKKSGTNIINFSHKDPKTKIEDYVPQQIRVSVPYKKSVDLTVVMVKIITTDVVAKEPALDKKKSKKITKPIIGSETISPLPKEPVVDKVVAVKTIAEVKKKKLSGS